MNERAKRGSSTRARIVATARRLFTTSGYAGTSTEALLQQSAVSRGALYHHFENKEALFAAVLEAVEIDIASATARAAGAITDPVEAVRVAFDTFLDLTRSPEVQQIVLTDAPAVLGWQKWREIEQRHGLGRLKQRLRMIAAAGRIPEDLVDVFAHMLLATLIEVALLIHRAPDRAVAARSGRSAMTELLQRLLGS